MKNCIIIGLFYHLYIYKCCFALYSSKELDIYSVFVKPYGINFTKEIILKLSPDFNQCADLNKSFEGCNTIATNLTSSTSASEYAKLKSLSQTCASGSYGCFYETVKSDLSLKKWFIKVQDTVRNLCKQQCWKTMQLVVDRCIQSGQSAVKASDRNYIQFVNELLSSLCLMQDESSCADKFVNGLLKNSAVNDPSTQVCDVEKSIKNNTCLSKCHMDVWNFYNSLGCCIGSVSNIMDCYSIKPQSDSYGVFVFDSKCNIKEPTPCSASPKCPLTPTAQSSSKSSSKGKQIAGIVIAVLICLGLVFIAGNYMYKRMKRREAIRFEDYGYSRLKMLEDDFYFDVEDDDESTGLVQA